MNMKHITAAIAVAITGASAVQAEGEKYFDGGFIGAEVGYLDAGDGANGLMYGATAGFRKQTDSDMVYGIEGSFGTSKVDISVGNFVVPDIDYQVWTALATVAWVAGSDKRNLLSLGAGVVYNTAELTYAGQSVSANGTSIAGAVSFERAIGSNFSVRVRASTIEFENYIGSVAAILRF